MCNNRECAIYLKKNLAYGRLMKELQKKWKIYGRIAGNITLKNATEEERRSIGGIVGKSFMDETIKITFEEFEQGLQKTRYAPIDMKSVLEEYFESALYTNKEQKVQVQIARDEFLDALFAYFEGCVEETSVVLSWIRELQCHKKYGYQILIREFTSDSKEAETLARNVGRALVFLDKMEEEECLLAVFAATVSGNPHYFDRGTTASQLLTHAVCFWKEFNFPEKAYEWRECMLAVGIVSDNISSMVHAFGVQLETNDGLHPAGEAFNSRKEPYVLTAENLKSIVGAKAKNNKVYVVENEMVFLYLVENAKEQGVTLLCTSGQLRVAAFQLLDYLSQSGAIIYYSGDLDPDGMDIADRLWRRYGNAVRMWRMNAEDYNKSISEEKLSERQLVKLKNLNNTTLCHTAEFVRREKKAGYQENLLRQLLSDILSS
jgi:uncharacterized protein (TIGR02679 family)